MKQYLWLFLFCVFTLSLCLSNIANAQTIYDVRFGIHNNQTRIVIDTDQKLRYDIDVLPSPPRLIFDVSAQTTIQQTTHHDQSRLITRTRYGRPKADTKRIVFDLSKPVTVKSTFVIAPSQTTPYHRIVIDIEHGHTINRPPLKSVNIKGPTPKPTSLKKSYKKKYLITLDPGHGGGDPGAIGPNRIKEKDIVLSLAKIIKANLESSGRFDVVLTRQSDHYIKLRDRFKKARDRQSNLFISLHADKIHLPSVRGASVYTLSETASDKETARLAQQENNAGVVAGVDLAEENDTVANILLDLVRRETLNESKLFAELLVTSMKKHNIRRLNNTHRFAGFAVLKAPDIPSVLIEAGFMSNKHDAQLLQTRDYQNRLAGSISDSVHQFFDRIEHLQGQ